MKRIVFAMFAAITMLATAEYQFFEVRGRASGICGNVVGFDVQSTNSTQTASLSRVRGIVTYTNALDIAFRTVTNQVYFVETNGVQGVSNVVSTVCTTNGYKKAVSGRRCVTNAITSATCSGGFATSTNLNAWILKDDSLLVNCTDKSAKTTVIISK